MTLLFHSSSSSSITERLSAQVVKGKKLQGYQITSAHIALVLVSAALQERMIALTAKALACTLRIVDRAPVREQ